MVSADKARRERWGTASAAQSCLLCDLQLVLASLVKDVVQPGTSHVAYILHACRRSLAQNSDGGLVSTGVQDDRSGVLRVQSIAIVAVTCRAAGLIFQRCWTPVPRSKLLQQCGWARRSSHVRMRSWRGTCVVEANTNTAELQAIPQLKLPDLLNERYSACIFPRNPISYTYPTALQPRPHHSLLSTGRIEGQPHAPPSPHISRDRTPLRNPPRLRQFAGDAAIDSQAARLGLITDCGRLRLRLVKSALWKSGGMLGSARIGRGWVANLRRYLEREGC